MSHVPRCWAALVILPHVNRDMSTPSRDNINSANSSHAPPDSHRTMDPPNMDPLSLSDSDEDALFDTPAAKKNKKQTQDADADAGKARKESHYTTEEAREANLRRELESIRNVNKVIEGVVESLQKAKDNMEVSG